MIIFPKLIATAIAALVPIEAAVSSIDDTNSITSISIADQQMKNTANHLLNSLQKKDFQSLRNFARGSEEKFFNEKMLRKEIYNFIYHSQAAVYLGIKNYNDKKNDTIRAKYIPQEKERYILIFYLESDESKLLNIKFLEEQWMKKYIACDLIKSQEGELIFYENFCFAETGGPFPTEGD